MRPLVVALLLAACGSAPVAPESGLCVFGAEGTDGVAKTFKFTAAGEAASTGIVPDDFTNLDGVRVTASCLRAAGVVPGNRVPCSRQGAHAFVLCGVDAPAFDCTN